MLSIVFAKYVARDFNSDMTENILHSDEKQREYMHSYGIWRKRMEHDHTYMLT